MSSPFKELAALTISLVACAYASELKAQDIPPEIMAAACRAQNYLQSNGYLDRIEEISLDSIYVDITDRAPRDSNGNPNIREFLDEREGTFRNKLYGVRFLGEYTHVGYKFDMEETKQASTGYYMRCVSFENGGDWIRLMHQECIDRDFTPVSEYDLRCD